MGTGSLDITLSGLDLTFTLNKGTNNLNDVLVIYIDGQSGGSTSTALFTDATSGLAKAISGFDGATNRATFTFASGFTPEYAIAFQPGNGITGAATVVLLKDNSSHTVTYTPALSNNNTTSAATYSVTVPSSSIGLVTNFKFMATYISNTGYRADEAIGDPMTGFTQGWKPYTSTTAPLEFNGILPVVFGSLNGVIKNGSASLTWNTKTEINFKHFEIEKSVNGTTWQSIGTVASRNIINGAQYSFIDNNVTNTKTFYRLKLLNVDGSFVYSPVIILRLDNKSTITLLGNPAKGTINLSINNVQGSRYKMDLFSLDGKRILTQFYAFAGGAANASLPIPANIKGMCILKVTHENEWQTFNVIAQ